MQVAEQPLAWRVLPGQDPPKGAVGEERDLVFSKDGTRPTRIIPPLQVTVWGNCRLALNGAFAVLSLHLCGTLRVL